MERLEQQHTLIRNIVSQRFQQATSFQDKELLCNHLKELLKLEKVLEQYRIEKEYLRMKQKTISNKLLKLEATFKVGLIPFLHYLPQEQAVIPERRVLTENEQIFNRFVRDRVRQRKDGYTETTGEKVSIKEIVKCYKRWSDVSNSRKFTIETLQNYCEIEFGNSDGKGIYQHLRVFLDEEDVEEFDRLHQEYMDDMLK